MSEKLSVELARGLTQSDARYSTLDRMISNLRSPLSRRYKHLSYIRRGVKHQDRRSLQEREKAVHGAFYPFICAARAEEQNTARVAKAQAALQFRRHGGFDV